MIGKLRIPTRRITADTMPDPEPDSMDKKLAFLLICAALMAWSPPTHADPVGCPAPPEPQNIAPTDPPNLGLLKDKLRVYRCTRYDAELAAVAAQATAWIDERAGQVERPALVLDIDETSLSNWDEIFQNDYGYIPGGACDLGGKSACGVHDWEISARAPAIKPTLELFNLAKARNVAVFFVTGRHDDVPEGVGSDIDGVERAATKVNLRVAGYAGWDGLYLRNPRAPGASVAAYKRDARIAIERLGYHIIANVGDQESDLALGHADRTFKYPNPFYVIP
jgi:acid phosphatase